MRKQFLMIALLTFFFILIILSCEKDSTSPKDDEYKTGTVTDIGNTYQTVKIGDQWWMAENLKVTHYRNGDAIPNVTDNTDWFNLTTGACCNYDNNAGNAGTYGRLYNWYAVDDSGDIAPAGWHVPTDAELQTLVDFLGSVAGGKMKETGTAHWRSPNTGATNESGFSALPGGYRWGPSAGGGSGYFDNLGDFATFGSAESYISDYAYIRYLGYPFSYAYRLSWYKQQGVSVRCVRD